VDLNSNINQTLEFDKIISQISALTISPLGNALIDQLNPLSDINTVRKKLSEVTELREILDFDDPFPIFGLKDINPALKKAAIQGNFLKPEELIAVSSTLSVFKKVTAYLKSRKEKYPLLNNIAADLHPFPKIENEINRCINTETAELFDNASPSLARLRKAKATTQQRIRKIMENAVKSLAQKNYLQENVITIRDGRLVLMVKDEYRKQVKGIVHDQSSTGATLFIEPLPVLELNNQLRALEIEEKREIEKILIHLTSLIYNELEPIQQSLHAAAYIEFVYAKARFSAKIQGQQPFLNDKHELEMIKARHPLLLLRHENIDDVIPLDLKIGEAFNTLVITGPNAGGKTVALKTIGLLSLMTHCGLHIPVDPSSTIPIFQNIFSAIGDQQSIENDLSTFSSHIETLTSITDHASHYDLVIIDEICSGTDPDEGAALAVAILEKFSAIGCITIVTTHQGALKAYAHEAEQVENGSMEFNAETLQPTYRFRLGLPGSSYAFEIAQRWGLSVDIINRSRQLVGKDKHRLENLLVDLDKKLTDERSRLNDISIKETELDGLMKLYHEKRKELTESEKKLKQDAVIKAEEILKSANALVEQSIKEIKEKQASREAIRATKERIENEKRKVASEKKESLTLDNNQVTDVSLGQTVKWKSFGKIGTILSEIDASQKVLLETGNVKIRVPVSELEAVAPEQSSKRNVRISYDIETSSSASEIDLRGMNAEEAIDKTAKFIETALLAGLYSVNIIHGKGTGVLRKSISQFLDSHVHVKSRRLADWNQGGSGVTVVELK